ncbi:MAG: hexokinase [Paludibacter sp.]|nr:hexokinase [Paludibacter sp.]
MENIFELTDEQLEEIANCLEDKINEGLKKDRSEILCIPTYISPRKEISNEKVLALDWGGTNFRAAIVEFTKGKPQILETVIRTLSAQETNGFKQHGLFDAMANAISKLDILDQTVTHIGYCFSYPAVARLNGDAVLLNWAKEISIADMLGEHKKPNDPNNIVGEPLVKYLNSRKDIIKTEFKNIKVINDTVACLFAGLSFSGYDNYAGLIVGTGTNMASLMRSDKIEKLNNKQTNLIPINLESGNFHSPYLTIIDDLVDATTNNKGVQRFEKAISGGYLGEIFKIYFVKEKIKYDFNGEDLSKLIGIQNDADEKVQAARQIAERSAKLVAASITGLVQVLVKQDKNTQTIGLAVDGSVFWKTPNYKNQVENQLKSLLPKGVTVKIFEQMSEPNLIGSAIAALS